ncbi:MAG: Gfo/Idh/MocA family oxidoreductase [Verrucomicrobia bacterium]|nr:Gfo/Idh/MocA family oxidoreductase [Verrucomicrobiota bacterium]
MKKSLIDSSTFPDGVSRRRFLHHSSLAATSVAVAAQFPFVTTSRAAPDDPIRIGLIGCGGRGNGAAFDALAAGTNVRVVALGDIFKNRMELAQFAFQTKQQNIPEEHCFLGFDAYQKVLAVPEVNCVILATPPGFRPIHLRAAVEAGKHVFMEAPVAVDPVGVRSILESGEIAAKKKLSLVAGTQRRHQNNYKETVKRLQDGAIGEILVARVYGNSQGDGQLARDPALSDMEWHLRAWHTHTWLSGDLIVEQHVHNLDVVNWILNGHPIRASGMGGRQVRTLGYAYDHFAVEFEYANGTRMFSQCRQINGCQDNMSEAVTGLKGTSDCFQSIQVKGEKTWRFPKVTTNFKAGRGDGGTNLGYPQEHIDWIQSIRSGQPMNDAKQAAESTLTAILGRLSAYTGKVLDWDAVLNAKLNLSPPKFEIGPIPTPPVPVPGQYKIG